MSDQENDKDAELEKELEEEDTGEQETENNEEDEDEEKEVSLEVPLYSPLNNDDNDEDKDNDEDDSNDNDKIDPFKDTEETEEVRKEPEENDNNEEAEEPTNNELECHENINDNNENSKDSSNKEREGEEDLAGEEEEESMPLIRISEGIFDKEQEDEEEEMEIQNMMEVNMNEDSNSSDKIIIPPEPRRPKRAAAEMAEQKLKKISNIDEEDESDKTVSYNSKTSSPSTKKTYTTNHRSTKDLTTPEDELRPCHVCKKIAVCSIVVKKYGADLHMCSNICFNTFRNPVLSKKVIPCNFCNGNNDLNYYWETMNFCSDGCVGKYQLKIGSKCSSCYNYVNWSCLGKYCVRFGSEIKQFCTASCLEAFKKGARVCHHCQIDVKRLGNVVLANLPNKVAAKEFCSQDCVEMYVEQNFNTPSNPKHVICVMCGQIKLLFREIVMPNGDAIKTCSEPCWQKILESKRISNTVKCEICNKYINSLNQTHYVVNQHKLFLFCTPICKNVFILKKREIMSCTTCKVKKYNYDLITNLIKNFAVCSLNCIPNPSTDILMLKDRVIETCKNNPSNIPPLSISTTSALPQLYEHNQNQQTNGPYRFTGDNMTENEELPSANASQATQSGLQMDQQIQSNFPLANGDFGFDWADAFAKYQCLIAMQDDEEVEYSNKSCMAKPRQRNKGVQVVPEELGELSHRQFIPIPIPVFIPLPYNTPYFSPFVIPIPIPLHIRDEDGEAYAVCEKIKRLSKSKNDEEMDSAPTSPLTTSEASKSKQNKGSSSPVPSSGTQPNLKLSRVEYGLRAWKLFFNNDPLKLSQESLIKRLVAWVQKGQKPSGERYKVDLLFFLIIGVQECFRNSERTESFFYDQEFDPFVDAFTEYAEGSLSQGLCKLQIVDDNLWETSELGASSPGVLLFTMIFFLYKHFNYKDWEDHFGLIHKNVIIEESDTTPSYKYLTINDTDIKIKERTETPERCPVRLVEIYREKCGVDEFNKGLFYKSINRNKDSDLWYSEVPLEQMEIYRMLTRAMMIKGDFE